MCSSAELRMLILADIHYGPMEEAGLDFLPKRWPARGLDLIRRAIEDAKQRGTFDCIVLLGDLIEDGSLPEAGQEIAEVHGVIKAAAPDVPLLVLPGNHDGDYETIYETFNCRPGLHEVGPYKFVIIADFYADDNVCTRAEADRKMLRDIARKNTGPFIVLQHSPMNPYIESDYPFMLTNRDDVMQDYVDCGVWLCLGAHYHPGQPLSEAGGVLYWTAPALSEEPFRYAVITLRGREVEVEDRQLPPSAKTN